MRGARVKMLREEIKSYRVGAIPSEWRRFKRAWTREGYAGIEAVFRPKFGPVRRTPGAARPPGLEKE